VDCIVAAVFFVTFYFCNIAEILYKLNRWNYVESMMKLMKNCHALKNCSLFTLIHFRVRTISFLFSVEEIPHRGIASLSENYHLSTIRRKVLKKRNTSSSVNTKVLKRIISGRERQRRRFLQQDPLRRQASKQTYQACWRATVALI
jgi:hypothetical protein